MITRKEIEIGGKPLIVESGRLAKQADGAVTVRYGDTVVLVTAVSSATPREGVDFLPLTVDYREATYAAGKIPGGFFKREGRPNEKEVLTSRMIDRPLRPLFPAGWNCETQVIGMLLSSDQENDSDVLAITGASFALGISNIPFPIPIAAVRVGLSESGEYLINPTFRELETSRLNLVVAGSEQAVVMVEAGARECTEEQMLDGILRGHDAIRKIVAVQHEMIAEIGRPAREAPARVEPAGLAERLTAQWKDRLADAMRIKGKLTSYAAVDELKNEMLEQFDDDQLDQRTFAKRFWHELQDVVLREEVLRKDLRLDGRRFDEIRDLSCDVGVLPRTHGSALFTRGETQALVTVTLGTSADAQRLDFVEGESTRRFILHYNFPPFSVGEARFLRGPGRREIGHGALAERSLSPLVPGEDVWPYTLRVVSDILESNGSSSMATICGASLALMDAGVPLRSAVAGIAMGLVKDGDRAVVLTDIAGAEDHHGDMDFKVAGTDKGITGLQMDIKITGITREIFAQALEQARRARLAILDRMNASISTAREAISRFAPRIITITINKDKIRDVIGPGGKMIRSITERTGCKIEINDDGRIDIASTDENAARQAVEIIKELTAEAELGKTYVGKVVRVVNFGAFVEILPGVEGLLHISEIANRRIGEVRDVLNEGDETVVKVIDIDAQGRVRLSRRAALPADDPDAGPSSESGGGRGGGDRERSDRHRDGGGPRRRGGRDRGERQVARGRNQGTD
ncbi:MAG TPA: polyribonucleotide nucleotidyltransferase [Candidatus Polarisedimenticolaceae bacterium]|nr:polyribonucleotide nucleotidyltransferase [Candidatus Polarisedimenticolaceae bacterium]